MEEIVGVVGCGNRTEAVRLGKVKTVGKIVGARVRESERAEVELLLDEFQNAAEIMVDVRNIMLLRVG